MSPAEVALILFGVFGVLIVLRVPVAFALGLACIPVFFIEPRLTPIVLMTEMFKSYNAFVLLAVPFFLLAANLMNAAGITDRLIGLARAMVGRLPGGLGHINVVVSMFFAGISGSSTADAAGIGSLLIPQMVRQGFSPSFAVAITACSSVMGVIIPPSILMIVWGGVLTTSIGALFLAGIIPGLMLAGVQMATVHFYAKARRYPTYPKATWGELAYALFISVPALMTPFIIIGGKIFGWFTPTEAACIAVLYALALSFLVYREMDGRRLFRAFSDTGRFAAITLFAVGTASAFGWLLAFYKIPEALLSGVSAWEMGPVAAGFFVAAAFLVVGCFLDAIPAIIIVGTILQPITVDAGIHPVHFAMIAIVSLAFGLVTPPYGLCLLICCSIANVRLVDVLKDVCIMLLPMLGVLCLLILWPDMALLLPRLLEPEFLQ
jgi:tripartite ATP-independent transporter DctM subunit